MADDSEESADSAATLLGHELMTALIKVASGIAKNTPANPQMPPNMSTEAALNILCMDLPTRDICLPVFSAQ